MRYCHKIMTRVIFSHMLPRFQTATSKREKPICRFFFLFVFKFKSHSMQLKQKSKLFNAWRVSHGTLKSLSAEMQQNRNAKMLVSSNYIAIIVVWRNKKKNKHTHIHTTPTKIAKQIDAAFSWEHFILASLSFASFIGIQNIEKYMNQWANSRNGSAFAHITVCCNTYFQIIDNFVQCAAWVRVYVCAQVVFV